MIISIIQRCNILGLSFIWYGYIVQILMIESACLLTFLLALEKNTCFRNSIDINNNIFKDNFTDAFEDVTVTQPSKQFTTFIVSVM